MECTILTKPILENSDHEQWIYEITIDTNETPWIVYIDVDDIKVRPYVNSADDVLQTFKWNDYIFANVQGNVEAAAIIAVLAVHFN